MKTEFLLVGQGLCGSWLSYFLQQEHRDFIVLDPGNLPNASIQAGGIINPVTGRRLVTTWLADQVIPFAITQYGAMGNLLKKTLLQQRDIVQFFLHPDTATLFLERSARSGDYLQWPTAPARGVEHFNSPVGYGLIKGACQVQPDELLTGWKNHLIAQGRIRTEAFDTRMLDLSGTRGKYLDISFDRLLFCDGMGAVAHSWFGHLPYAPNKGEALILNIPGLPNEQVYKGPLTLIPTGRPDQWWAGSSYQWDFNDALPSEAFLRSATKTLADWLRLPFTVVEHRAAVRPGSKERRPFAGLSPVDARIGLLNGMGTKGCSLAPYFAAQLVQHLLYEKPIHPEADLARFTRN